MKHHPHASARYDGPADQACNKPPKGDGPGSSPPPGRKQHICAVLTSDGAGERHSCSHRSEPHEQKADHTHGRISTRSRLHTGR
jgi:hypothetical protein